MVVACDSGHESDSHDVEMSWSPSTFIPCIPLEGSPVKIMEFSEWEESKYPATYPYFPGSPFLKRKHSEVGGHGLEEPVRLRRRMTPKTRRTKRALSLSPKHPQQPTHAIDNRFYQWPQSPCLPQSTPISMPLLSQTHQGPMYQQQQQQQSHPSPYICTHFQQPQHRESNQSYHDFYRNIPMF